MENVVAIVGRPNVGKSSLFNRLARKDLSLVHDRPGVTRDRLITECFTGPYHFTLIDTGGIGYDDNRMFADLMMTEVDLALEAATDIIFVVDGKDGLMPTDKDVARRLRQSNKRVLLVVNKVDTGMTKDIDNDFYRLGFDEIYPTSASHGKGVKDMLDALTRPWKPREEGEVNVKAAATKIAFVGRPNVGKSSLTNAIMGEKRVIVSDIPGTTRDAVSLELNKGKERYILVDTAGLRKKARISDTLETIMSGRSVHAIKQADVCAIIIDAVEGITEQDKKIAGLVQEARKSCLVIVNKWDLAIESVGKEKAQEMKRDYEKAVLEELFFMSHIPVVFLSAKQSQGLSGFWNALNIVAIARQTKFNTSHINRILAKAMQRTAPPRKGAAMFKLYYATQSSEEDNTCPTLMLFVNNKELMTEHYLRYLETKIREFYPCTGSPIRMVMKEHEGRNFRKAKSLNTRASKRGRKKSTKAFTKRQIMEKRKRSRMR